MRDPIEQIAVRGFRSNDIDRCRLCDTDSRQSRPARIISIFAPLDRRKLLLAFRGVSRHSPARQIKRCSRYAPVCVHAIPTIRNADNQSVISADFAGQRDLSENSTEISRSLELIIPRRVSSFAILILIPEACGSRSGLLRARLISQLAIVSSIGPRYALARRSRRNTDIWPR